MDTPFDSCFHADPGALNGSNQCWLPGSRFIHEYTFCLMEGIFANHVPHYDHSAFVEVPREHWPVILADLATLHHSLERANSDTLPYGSTLRLQDREVDQPALATLISELTAWLRVTLTTHDSISILGL